MFFFNLAFFAGLLFSSFAFAYDCAEVVEKLNRVLIRVDELEKKIDFALKKEGDLAILPEHSGDVNLFDKKGKSDNRNINGLLSDIRGEHNLDVDGLRADLFSDKSSEKDLYDQAYMLMKNGNHREAESNFHSFLLMFPSSKFAPEANYWIAEINYHQGNFRNAAVYFVKSYTADSNGIRAPMSLLKLSSSLVELKNSSNACSILSKLFRNFPDLIYSLKSQACELSARIKCEHYEDFCS